MLRKTLTALAWGACAVAVGVLLRVTGVSGILTAPLQQAVVQAAETVDIGGYRARYERAERELAEARRALAEAEEAVHTADFYREFLALKEHRPSLSLCDAWVIAERRSAVTLSVGEADGIRVGMAVMTVSGLVGVVSDAGLATAQVRAVTHPEVTVQVTVCRTGDDGEMTGGVLTLPRGSTATTGDRVMTSGVGGVYPRGLLIGQLGAVEEDPGGLFRTATVIPYAACERRVMVITGW